MKKIIVIGMIAVIGVSASAGQLTLGTQDATKTGLPAAMAKINANFTEVYTGLATAGSDRLAALEASTNRVALAVTNATVSAQTVDITYQGVDGSTNTISVCTNVVITISR